MPKVNPIRSSKQLRHDPLEKQIIESQENSIGNLRKPKNYNKNKKNDNYKLDNDNTLISSKISKSILDVSNKLQNEVYDEDNNLIENNENEMKLDFGASNINDEDDDINDQDDTYDEDMEEVEIDENDEELLAKFMPNSNIQSKSLNDIIMDKIAEKERERAKANIVKPVLDEKVVTVFTQVGTVLSKWTTGKLPKAFKIIPSLKNWEEILALTNPYRWTPNAMFAATNIFVHNMNPKLTQRFFHTVLLPAVRLDIEKNKKLNFHYYTALKKAVYKPSAFFKGLVLPLLSDSTQDDESLGNGTIREAVIISSVIQKVSLPVEHAAVTILKLLEIPFGISAIILKTLLNKKYSLPVSVISKLVDYFCSFINESRTLPVLWHSTLLVFAQRYKLTLTLEQKEQLKGLLKHQLHRLIGPEIRRELFGKVHETSNDMDRDDAEMKLQ